MSATNYRWDADAIADRVNARVKRSVARDVERAQMMARGELCAHCGYYKRGEDGTCVDCGEDWPLPERNPASA